MPKPRLYLDSCIFIDMAKVALGIGSASLEQERLEDIWFARRLCDAARDGAIQIFTSTLTVAECQHVDQQITDQVKDLFDRFLTSGQVATLIAADIFVAEEARGLRWDHGLNLKGADAIHVASARHLKCDEFLTTDGQIRKQKFQAAKPVLARAGLHMIRPSETQSLPNEYRQGDMLAGQPSEA